MLFKNSNRKTHKNTRFSWRFASLTHPSPFLSPQKMFCFILIKVVNVLTSISIGVMDQFAYKDNPVPQSRLSFSSLNLPPIANSQPIKLLNKKSPLLFSLPYTSIQSHIVLQQQNNLQMQYSLMSLSSGYDPMLFYPPGHLYLPPHLMQSPFCMIDFHNLYNYQFLPQNVPLYDHSAISSPSQWILSPPPLEIQPKEENDWKPSTQNGKEDFSISSEMQRKNPCVIQYKLIKCQKQEVCSVPKSGNDRFIKKNTESNVVNQIFSFLWTPEKSRDLLTQILKEPRKMDLFYQLMRSIKANCKSQLNRFYLKSLMKNEEWQSGFKKLKKKMKKMEEITLEEVCNAIKKLVFYYLREINRFSIMTSKKMNPKLWKLHFGKCREILAFLFTEGQQ